MAITIDSIPKNHCILFSGKYIKNKKTGKVSKDRKSFEKINELKASDQIIIINLLNSLYQKRNSVIK
jgi:hypothetical protein